MSIVNVEDAMDYYGEQRCNGLEVPDFYRDEPLCVFYDAFLLQTEDVVNILEQLPEHCKRDAEWVGNSGAIGYIVCQDVENEADWTEADMKIASVYYQPDEYTLASLIAEVIIGVDFNEEVPFNFEDMLDAACRELTQEGII